VGRLYRRTALPLLLLALSECTPFTGPETARLEIALPSVAPANQPATSLIVDTSPIRPMYDRRMFAVDLSTTVRVAMARNIDIQAAQQHVAASRGEYEANIGMIFPTLSPNITARGLRGAVSTPTGLTVLSFNHVFPTLLLQWIINPGQVVYDIIASKRRLEASEQQDLAVVQETIRAVAVQYYDVVLAQAQVGVALRSLEEAKELLRIEDLGSRTGTALPVDELRAKAALAAREQNLLTALNDFYNASVALTVMLRLDPTVILVPKRIVKETTLVREDLSIDDMLVMATRYRPDLAAIRTLVAAADADVGSTVWGGLGPQINAFGRLTTPPPAKTLSDTLYRERTYRVTAGFNWSAATFGRIRTAIANAKIADIDAERQLDLVQAAVVTAHQTSLIAKKKIPLAQQEVAHAEEALRLTQENLVTGTGLTIDVLVAQDASNQARLRYVTAVIRYNQAEINLLATLGLIDDLRVVGGRIAAADGAKPSSPSGPVSLKVKGARP
jgi:outer membrane protein TolC